MRKIYQQKIRETLSQSALLARDVKNEVNDKIWLI
jgi:transposase